MKKISLIALAFCTSAAVFAQDQPTLRTEMATRPYFGLKAGVNLANFRMSDDPDTNTDTKTSFLAGFVGHIPIGSMLAFQPELLYMGAGAKSSETTTGVTTTIEQDLHYIALPLMLQVKPGGSGFFIEAGPQLGYLIRAKAESGGMEVDNKESFDKFDFAVNGGLGFTTRVGFGISARYSYGLANILKDDGGTGSDNMIKNTGFQFGLHYLFGASK